MSEKVNIIITTLPLSVGVDVAFRNTVHDNTLIGAIVQYRKKLESEDVEVYKRVNNVIVTEKGYFFAFYESDLIAYENLKPNQEQSQ
jgi:predicted Zn-dependent protease with MMP-like domain